MPGSNLSFCVVSYVCIMYDFSFCRWATSCVSSCMSSNDVHTGIFTAVLMAFTLLFMPVISWSFSSVWLFLDSKSAHTGLGQACI